LSRRIFFWLKALIAAMLLAMMVFTIRPRPIIDAMLAAQIHLVVAAAVLMPLNILIQERKWAYLVRLARPETTLGETWGSLLGGYAFGIVTPGRIGEYGRSLLIRNADPLKLVGLTVIDKFYNLGLTTAIGLPALFTLPWAFNLADGYIFGSMIILLAAIDGLLLYFALDPRPVRSLIYAAQMMLPKGERVAQLIGGLDRFTAPQARITFGFTLLHYSTFLVQYFLLLNAFAGIDLLNSSRGASAILFTKSALPIAIGDLGLDQLVSVQFFGQLGITSEAAFNASLLLFAINVVIPALAGLLFVGRLQIGKRNGSKA
jgi:hypothetical protein